MKLSTKNTAVLFAVSTTVALGLASTTQAVAEVNNPIGITSRDNVPAYSAGTPAMKWGIKQSFVNYVGGFTHVLDGAEVDGTDILWPATSPATVDEDGNVVANFGGTVNFMKYCDDSKVERGRCKLDFTAFDPQIIYNTVSNTGGLYITLHSYILDNGISGPGHWMGPKTIKFANLDGANSKFNIDNGVVSFEAVGVFLTEAGAETLPTYSAGLRVDDLSFSYKADEVKTGDVADGFSADTNRTDVLYSDHSGIFPINNRAAVLTSKDGDRNTLAIVDESGDVIVAPKEYDAGVMSPMARVNPAGTEFFWRGAGECTLNAVPVSNSGIGTKKTVFTFPEDECDTDHSNGFFLDYAFDQSNGTIGLVSMTKSADIRNYKFRVIDSAGSVLKEVDLPNHAALYGTAPEAEQYGEPYGSPYAFSGKHSLHSLNDGTFLSVYDHNVETTPPTGGIPVHITPDSKPTASIVDAMAGQFYDKSHSYRNAAVGDGLVVIYNNHYGNHPSFQKPEDKKALRTGTYSYSGGQFAAKQLKYLGNDWDHLADIEVTGPNELLVVSANTQPKTGIFDASTLELTGDSTGLSDMKNAQNNDSSVIARVGDSFLVLGHYEKEFKDYATIHRLYKASGQRTATPSVAPVTMPRAWAPKKTSPTPTATTSAAPTSVSTAPTKASTTSSRSTTTSKPAAEEPTTTSSMPSATAQQTSTSQTAVSTTKAPTSVTSPTQVTAPVSTSKKPVVYQDPDLEEVLKAAAPLIAGVTGIVALLAAVFYGITHVMLPTMLP